MKHTLTLFFAFLFCTVNAQTTITSDTIYGVLTAAGSPYLVDHDVTIPVDSSLTLEAGVTIEVTGRKMIACYGAIYSMGTEANPNKLTCTDDTLPNWHGLKILGSENQDTSILRWTTIEKSYNNSINNNVQHNGYDLQGAGINAIDGKVLISHCTFTSLTRVLRIYRGYVRIDSSTFIDNNLVETGILGSAGGGDIIIRDCDFKNNSGYLSMGYFTNTDVPNITNCTFRNHGKLGCLWLQDNVWADSCLFIKNNSTVMTLAEFLGTVSNCTFDSTITNNGHAANIKALRSYTNGLVRDCTFKNTYSNGNLQPADVFSLSGIPTILNCYFYNGLGVQGDDINIVNTVFYKNRWDCVWANNAKIINCLFLENRRIDKADNFNGDYEWRRRSSSLYVQSKCDVFNSIFWGNKNYFNENMNCTYLNTSTDVNFYNCIMESGQSSISANDNDTFTHQDIFQDCITSNPLLDNNPARQFRYVEGCSAIPSGYNKGYTQPIAIKYNGLKPDVLNLFTDLDGNTRVMDDTADIGPFETQALWSEIKVDSQPTDLAACLGDEALLDFDIRGLGTTSQWQQSTDGVLFTPLGSQSSSYRITSTAPEDSGVWYRNYTFNMCGDTVYSDTVQLTVNAPQPIYLGDDFSLRRDSSAELEIALGLEQYIWSTGDSTSSITLQGNTIPKGDTTISVATTDKNGCIARDTITITILQGVGIAPVESYWSVYPNPTTDLLYLKDLAQGEVTIHTMNGIQVLSTQVQADAVDVSSLPSGMYLIHVIHNGKVYRTRFVKE